MASRRLLSLTRLRRVSRKLGQKGSKPNAARFKKKRRSCERQWPKSSACRRLRQRSSLCVASPTDFLPDLPRPLPARTCEAAVLATASAEEQNRNVHRPSSQPKASSGKHAQAPGSFYTLIENPCLLSEATGPLRLLHSQPTRRTLNPCRRHTPSTATPESTLLSKTACS